MDENKRNYLIGYYQSRVHDVENVKPKDRQIAYLQLLRLRKERLFMSENISDSILPGSIVRTRDEFFLNGVPKPNHINDNLYYREAIVMETNKNDNLGLVTVTSKGKHNIPNFRNGKEKFSAYLCVSDNDGRFIKLGSKFKLMNYSIDQYDYDFIRDYLYSNKNTSINKKDENLSIAENLKEIK